MDEIFWVCLVHILWVFARVIPLTPLTVFPVPLGVLRNTSSAVYMHNYQHLRNTSPKAFSDFLLINKTDEMNGSELPGLVMVSEKLSQHERNHVFKWYFLCRVIPQFIKLYSLGPRFKHYFCSSVTTCFLN